MFMTMTKTNINRHIVSTLLPLMLVLVILVSLIFVMRRNKAIECSTTPQEGHCILFYFFSMPLLLRITNMSSTKAISATILCAIFSKATGIWCDGYWRLAWSGGVLYYACTQTRIRHEREHHISYWLLSGVEECYSMCAPRRKTWGCETWGSYLLLIYYGLLCHVLCTGAFYMWHTHTHRMLHHIIGTLIDHIFY